VSEFLETVPNKIGFLESESRMSEPAVVFYRVLMDELERHSLVAVAERNPLHLSAAQSYFLTYYILISDGDFLIPMLKELAAQYRSRRFTYLDAGSILPDVMLEVVTAFTSVIYLDDDRRKLSTLETSRERVLQDIATRREREGSGSKRDQIIVPRLEWLVDLGFLSRGNGESTGFYEFTPEGLDAATSLGTAYETFLRTGFPDQALSRLLDEHYAECMSHLAPGHPTVGRLDPETLIEVLRSTYDAIGSITGYVLLRPIVLASAIDALGSTKTIFEYSEFVRCLQEMHERHSDWITYTVDRLSTDYQVKLLKTMSSSPPS